LWELTNARRFALSSLTFMGKLAELARRAPKLLSEARERGHLYAETDLRTRLMAFTWLAQGKPELAEESAEEGLRRWSQQQGFHLQHYNHFLTRAQCSLYRGDAGAALARLDASWPLLEGSMLMRIQALRLEILYARGRTLLAALGRRTRATDAEVVRIAARIEREGVAWASPLAASLLAGVYHHRGQHDAVRRELERAIAGFDAVDMEMNAAAGRVRLAELLGGDQGGELRAKASQFFAEQAIVDGAAFVRLLSPGFGDAAVTQGRGA